ncbi:hypothetical protein M5D96_009210 [Drosophila gunungcola]|uniref:Uncharacterized protein n=1 Tax=Drosophila gunungcola TaxID=103775 RepID=A0A9P9YJ40_9MUSC|nr:hypothetical protein M5D96_009210 [Drosophila gunungcola]
MQAQQQARRRLGASQENQAGSRQDSHHGPQHVSGNIPQQEVQQVAQPFEHGPQDPHGPMLIDLAWMDLELANWDMFGQNGEL